jgi:(p)ppGpp synthase/HD superfamily hydrolase
VKKLWRVVRAYWFVRRAHAGQVDKAGVPYIHHLRRVALTAWAMTGDSEAAVVGLLHDYLEDVNRLGFQTIVDAWGIDTAIRVEALTRRTNDSYEAYIGRVMAWFDRPTTAVKIADLLHNLSPGRSRLSDATRTRYVEALRRIVDRDAHVEVASDAR